MLEKRKLRKKTVLILAGFTLFYANLSSGDSLKDMIIVPVADTQYSTAATQFQKALWMQVGVDKTLDKCQHNIDLMSKDVEKKAFAFIDSVSPIPHEKLMFIFGTAYAIGVKQEISGTFGDPFIKTATHTIKVTPQSGTFNMTIPL